MRVVLKKIVGIIEALIVLAAGAAAGLLLYLNTDHAAGLIQNTVNRKIPGAVTWKKHTVSAWAGRLEIQSLRVEDAQTHPLAGLDRLVIDLSWTALVRGTVEIEEMVLESPWVEISTDAEGGMNLVRAFSPPTPQKPAPDKPEKTGIPLDLVVRSLKITHGRVGYENPFQPLRTGIADVNLQAAGNLEKKSGQLALQLTHAAVSGDGIDFTVDRISIDAGLENGRKVPVRCLVKTASSQLLLDGWITDVLDRPSAAVNLTADVSLPEIRSGLHLDAPMTGRVTVHAELDGPVADPGVFLNVGYAGGKLYGYPVERIHAELKMKDRQVDLDPCRIDAFGGQVTAVGTIRLKEVFPKGLTAPQKNMDALSWRAAVRSTHLDLSKIPVPGDEMAGIVNAALSASGKGLSPAGRSLVASMSMKTSGLATRQSPRRTDLELNAEGELAGSTVELRRLEAVADGLTLTGDGRYDGKTGQMDAELALDASDLSGVPAVAGLTPVKGAVTLRARIVGPVKSPEADISMHGQGMAVQNVTIGNIQAHARFLDGDLTLDRFRIQNRSSELSITARARILDPSTQEFLTDPAFQCDVDADAFRLEDVTDRLKGTVSLSARLKGTPSRPQGRILLRAQDMDLSVQTLDSVDLAADLDGQRLRIDPLNITPVPGQSVTARGWVALDKTFQVELTTDGISLDAVDRIRNMQVAEGLVRLNVSGTGSVENPRLQGEIQTTSLRVRGQPVGDLTARLNVADHLARIDGNLNADFSAAYHLIKKDFSVSLRFDNSDLGSYAAVFNRPDAGGRLTGFLSAAGNAGAPLDVRASADIKRLNLVYGGKPAVAAENIHISLADRIIQVKEAAVRLLDTGHMNVSGQAALAGAVDIGFSGAIPLQAAGLFTDEVSGASGGVRFSGHVGNTLSEPDIRTELTLDDIGMRLPVTLQKLHQVRGTLRLTPRELVVEDVNGMLDTGRFFLSGRMNLKAFQPTDGMVQLKANALPVRIPDTLEAVLNADLNLTGTSDESALQGNVTLLEGTYVKDVKLSPIRMVMERKRETTPAPVEMTQPFLRNLGLDVTVQRRRPFIVDNNLAYLEIAPDLKIRGTLNRPVVTGRAGIETGTVRYQKKDFEVTRGVVDFINPYKIEPNLDIGSEVKIRKWTVFLDISGSPEQLRFKLRSDPQEEDADIISLLTFGRTTRELIQGEGGTSRSTSEMLAELVASAYAEDIRKSTGLDIFEVEAGAQDEEGENIKVTMGKELSERMTVKYETESKSGEMLQRAVAEYKLLEHVLLSGFQDSKGFFGGQFLFRLEFR